LRRGRVNEEGKGGRVWMRDFLYMYECGALKPVGRILRGCRR
jgi:hypothetical protein